MEILEPAGGPANIERVASGGADFCLTSVTHYLRARARSGDLAARFVSVVVRRSPMSAMVAADSALTTPLDLAGLRLGGPADSGLVAEFLAGMADLGMVAPVLVPLDYALAPAAMGRGEVDMVCDFVDLLPRVRLQSGVAVRAVPLGLDVYSSGLVAADRLSDGTVSRMQNAMAAALESQRADPRAGLPELARRYPEADPVDALEGWFLAEPNIFTGPPPGSSDPGTWARTIAQLAAAHGLPAPDPVTVYRPAVPEVSPSR